MSVDTDRRDVLRWQQEIARLQQEKAREVTKAAAASSASPADLPQSRQANAK